MTDITFTKGKKKREELKLPQLHFVVMDDWIEKLGHDAFIAWMKFHTWVDRTDEAEHKFGNKNTIPRSLEGVWESLGMKKTKFYQKVVHPLWNYGLIDIVEWKDSKKLGQKPKNVIVYEYPQNSYELAVKPLEKCRDYKTDYSTESAIFGRKGGRPKEDEEVIKSNRSQKQTVIEINDNQQNVDKSNRSQMKTVDRSQMKTVTVRKQKPINESNTIINESNTIINESNQSILSLEIPDKLKGWLIKYAKGRLIDSDLQVIEQEYSKGLLTDIDIQRILSSIFDYSYDNFEHYFKRSVQKYLDNKDKHPKQPIRKELVPNWKKQQSETQDTSTQKSDDSLDYEVDKQKFEELIGKFKE